MLTELPFYPKISSGHQFFNPKAFSFQTPFETSIIFQAHFRRKRFRQTLQLSLTSFEDPSPGDSGQSSACLICLKFAVPTIRITRHLLMLFLE